MLARRTLAALAMMMSLAAVARAAPMRAVVRMADARDDERLARVEGQTVDLDVEVIAAETGPIEESMRGQLATARALAAEHDARVIVWFRDDGDELIVYVADPEQDTLFVRSVTRADGGDTVGQSATAEAAALIARSALRALAAGGRIGVKTPEPAPQPPAPPIELDRAPPQLPGAPARWHAGLGAYTALDGESPQHPGLTAWLGRTTHRWRFDLFVAASAAARFDDELTSVSLARYTLGVAAGYRVTESLALELSAGAMDYYRTTAALSPDVVATEPSNILAAFAGPGVRWQLGGGRVRLELAAGVDAIAGVPELGYDEGGTFTRRTALWPLQPRASVGVAVQTF